MRAVVPCLLLGFVLASCGGSGASPKAQSPSENSGALDSKAESSSTSAEPEDQAPAESVVAKGLSCDDGTCSVCGTGMCPIGWYCDEGVSGGAACSWLKECAQKPSCSCLTRVLGSSCQCREENGGPKVKCG